MPKLEKDLKIKDRYLLLEKKGSGSFGEVWLAHDEFIDEAVAIKFYISLNEEGVREFKEEFKTAYSLKHDYLLTTSYYDIWEQRPFLVLDYCPNGSASNMAGNVTEEVIWQFIHDVASGLAYLHDQRPDPVVHQDIKPDNILVNKYGNFVITDFGISMKIRSTMRKQSGRNTSAGTVSYMAPERFSQNPTPIKASDIWSLGVTIYELATGELPFCGMGGAMLNKGAEIPVLPQTWSKDLNELMQACMANEPWNRPTADDIVRWTKLYFNGEKISFTKKKETAGKTQKKKFTQTKSEGKERIAETKINKSKTKKIFLYGLGGLLLSIMLFFGIQFITSKSDTKVKYEYIGDYTEGFAPVRLDSKYGFINDKNEQVIPLAYDSVKPFHNEYAQVCMNSLWGYIDTLGNIVVSLSYPENVTMQMALQGKWTQIEDVPWSRRTDVINIETLDKNYVMIKTFDSNQEFWEYDKPNAKWTHKKTSEWFVERRGMYIFSFNDEIYCGGGDGKHGVNNNPDLWKYETENDEWVKKASIPINHGLADVASFVIGGKGYLVAGSYYHPTKSVLLSAMYEYDVLKDIWTQKSDFPGPKRYNGMWGFSLNGKGYVGGGWNFVDSQLNDFWEFDPEHNSWKRKNDIPSELKGGRVLVVNGVAYAWIGDFHAKIANRLYAYDHVNDIWVPKAAFPGKTRSEEVVAFSYNNKIYIGGGTMFTYHYTCFNDMWEYDPNVEGETYNVNIVK